MRRDFFSLSVRCKHVCLLVCCWFYCISQNVSTSYTILTFPLRLHECSFPILSYLFLLSLLRLLLLLLHSVLLFFYTSLLWACAIISFHIIPLKRSTSDIHDAEYGALWIPLDVFFFHFFFAFRQHNSTSSASADAVSFSFCHFFYYSLRFCYTHFSNIFMHIGRCNGFPASFFPRHCMRLRIQFYNNVWWKWKAEEIANIAHTHTHTYTCTN